MKTFISKLEEGILAFLLASMTILVFVEVVLRFGFSTGFMWAQELTLTISAWMVIFGASYGLKVGAHLGVDALVRQFSPAVRRIIGLLGCLLGMTYCGLLMYGAYVYLAKMKKIGIPLEDLDIPRWIAHSILFIGFALLGVRLFQLFIMVLKGQADGFKLHTELKEIKGLYDADDKTAEEKTP